MKVKLFDSERKVMDILWKEGVCSAKHIAELLKQEVGWSKTTTYTVIKKCVEKGAVERSEPNFMCRAMVSKREVQEYETTQLINRMYDGAADQLVASILGRKNLSSQEIERLKQLIERLQ